MVSTLAPNIVHNAKIRASISRLLATGMADAVPGKASEHAYLAKTQQFGVLSVGRRTRSRFLFFFTGLIDDVCLYNRAVRP